MKIEEANEYVRLCVKEGRDIDLNDLKSAKGLVLPDEIGGMVCLENISQEEKYELKGQRSERFAL